MLIFAFSALIVLVDQLFKHWIVLTLSAGGDRVLIPGVLRLVYAENFGAAFGIFATGNRWPLAAVMLVAIIVLVIILRRYNGGFWGSLGLAAALGGGIGNLIDRVWNGYVVDMFEVMFINFAIFNVADIFITLGAITFFVHFIVTSGKGKKAEDSLASNVADSFSQQIDIPLDYDYNDDPELRDMLSDTQPIPGHIQAQSHDVINTQTYDTTDEIRDASFDAFDLEGFADTQSLTETNILEDYDLEKMLREYGLESDED